MGPGIHANAGQASPNNGEPEAPSVCQCQSPTEEHLTLSRRILLTQVADHVLLHCTGPSRVVPDDFWLTDSLEEAA